MRIRTLHSWIGMLIAPTVLFMAVTGILQIYNFHEARPGYTPPPLLEKFGRLHKDQVFAPDHHGPPPGFHPPAAGPKAAPGPDDGPPPGEAHHGPKPAVAWLKGVLTAVGAGLVVSTLLGLWMGLRDREKRTANAVLLLIGIVVPAVLAAMTA
jgi:hypothetical protein